MKFIIIHDGKKDSSKLADQLNATISQLEDITTTVWSEKQYIDNKPTLSSDEYLVFLGKTKTGYNISEATSFKNYYSEFNMHYGWLGKQAVIGLSPDFTFDEDKVKQFSDLYNATFKIEIENNTKEKKAKSSISEFVSNVDKKIKSVPKAGKIAALIGGGLFLGLFGSVIAVTSATYLVKGHLDNTKLNEDANKLLLKKFVDEGLKSFLNIKE